MSKIDLNLILFALFQIPPLLICNELIYKRREVGGGLNILIEDELTDQYIQRVIDKFGSIEKGEEGYRKLLSKLAKMEPKDLKALSDQLYQRLTEVLNEGCAYLMLSSFLEKILLDSSLKESNFGNLYEKIKKDEEFKEYLEKIFLNALAATKRHSRYRLSEAIKEIYRLRGKELPKLESRDRYKYREKFADEYLGMGKKHIKIDEAKYEVYIKNKEIMDCLVLKGVWPIIYGCKEADENELIKIDKLLFECDQKLKKVFGDLKAAKVIAERLVLRDRQKLDKDELKELLIRIHSKLEGKLKPGCIDVILGFLVSKYVRSGRYGKLREAQKKEIFEDKEFGELLEKVMLRGMRKLKQGRRHLIGLGLGKLYREMGKKLPKLLTDKWVEGADYEYSRYWDKYVDEYLDKES